ncbi:MAG: 30S ribosome-binding factor RbfA [Planctomycetaceae bacterium]|nr:30S ribosome-binding factor RbfA [Planctomycetaceae bacterium]
MVTRRIAKASRAIKEVVSKTILFEIHDPRVKDVTVLDVEVAPDMRSAKVYVSIMGPPKAQDLTLHGLNSARGFLQKRIGEEIDTRYTPILTFVKDDSVKKSIEAARILQQLADERLASGEEPSTETAPMIDAEAELRAQADETGDSADLHDEHVEDERDQTNDPR